MRADHAATENHHLGRIDAGDAAKQHPQPSVRLLEKVRPSLNRHAARNFRHRREQRQAAVCGSYCLVGNADGAARDQVLRLLGIGREMQIGEQ